jgi:diacylglycerol kinase family enzyme
MHYYIYDHYLNDKKYTPTINKIETRLTDLGINGRAEKLTILKSMSEIVSEVEKKGASTVVAVGNDSTVSKMISMLPNLNITLGIIPIGPNNEIAKILGIPEEEAACDTLSARLTEKIDLGKANGHYFISHIKLPSEKDIIIDCGNYNISPLTQNSAINICNFNILTNTKKMPSSDPKDGVLEAVFLAEKKPQGFFNIFKKKYSQNSVFPFKKLKVKCDKECLPAIADGHTTIKTPISIEVVPKKLKIIVGKNRMF